MPTMVDENRQTEISSISNTDSVSDFLHTEYEIEKISFWIKELGVKKVALQFPDDLLKDAADVALLIEKSSKTDVKILGDTSYGSCCVDTHAAKCANAEALVHFGRACLSKSNDIPVLYIFGKGSIKEEPFLAFIQETFTDQDHILLASDLRYHQATSCLVEKLLKLGTRVMYLEPLISSKVQDKQNGFALLGRHCSLLANDASLDNYAVVYIGEEESTITNLSLTLNKCRLYTYNPTDSSFANGILNVDQHLRKRYFCVHKAKEASLIGILVATLGVADHLDMIEHIKALAKNAGQKCYTFVVGKLNAQKLANFPEIDCFVTVACPENSLIDSKEFFRPILTPFEYEVAVNSARSWTGDYLTDFRLLLPGASHHIPIDSEYNNEDQTDVSLISGKMRHVRIRSEESVVENSSTELCHRPEYSMSTIPTGSDFLRQREWTGLEPHVGETPVTIAHVGRKGIAAGYHAEGNSIKDNDKSEIL